MIVSEIAHSPERATLLRLDAWRRFRALLPESRDPAACWEWTGFRAGLGYGMLRAMGRKTLAHRLSWMFANGEIPQGMCVCHRCDNPPCVNPAHLFLGTVDDNNKDRAAKGRSSRAGQPPPPLKGSLCPTSKLREADIPLIRALCTAGQSQQRVAEIFGTTQSNVSLIVMRKHWAHIPDVAVDQAALAAALDAARQP